MRNAAIPVEGKDMRRRQHLQPFPLTKLPPLVMMETPLFLRIHAHLPESKESQKQPGVHGFVLHSSDETPLHSLLHSWRTNSTVSTEKKKQWKKSEFSVVGSRLNAADGV